MAALQRLLQDEAKGFWSESLLITLLKKKNDDCYCIDIPWHICVVVQSLSLAQLFATHGL